MEANAVEPVRFASTMIARLSSELRSRRLSVLAGKSLQTACHIEPSIWEDFADCWNNLTQDKYMGDDGRYRFRRYGAFELDYAEGVLQLLPHAPYVQPSYINKLNGDVARHFDPLESRFVDNRFLEGLLRSLAQVFDAVQGYSSKWNIRLHPYRIRASPQHPGMPTPEGLHRDGVDFIVTMMIKRHNVAGGETSITDSNGRLLCRYTLMQPQDLILIDDTMTMHSVTPVRPLEPGELAFRDVLVIAYTRC